MAGSVAERLREAGIEIPEMVAPAANYVPFVRSADLVFVSGQVPLFEGELQYRGKLGRDLGVEEGREAARLCALNAIAAVRSACDGDLERVRRCLKLGGFVNCEPDFDQHPAVVNGASDLMVEVFGDRGRHARFAVGASSLPFGVAVEIDAVFEVESDTR